MGMSASQARLIALTARMNDIEYQGQQINQQRTTLSNQVNALYNSLLEMTVPTPPSTQDYTKIQYTGTLNASTFTLSNVTPKSDGTYDLKVGFAQSGNIMANTNKAAAIVSTSPTFNVSKADVANDTNLKSLFYDTHNTPKKGDAWESANAIINAKGTKGNSYKEDNLMIVTDIVNISDDMFANTSVSIYIDSDAQSGDGTKLIQVKSKNEIPDNATVYVVCNTADVLKYTEGDDGTTTASIDDTNGSLGKLITGYGNNGNVYKWENTTWESPKTDLSDSQKSAIIGKNLLIKDGDGVRYLRLSDITSNLNLDTLYKIDSNSNVVMKNTESKTPYSIKNADGSTKELYTLAEAKANGTITDTYYDAAVESLKHSFPDVVDVASEFYVYVEDGEYKFIQTKDTTGITDDKTKYASVYKQSTGTYSEQKSYEGCQIEFDNDGKINTVYLTMDDGKSYAVKMSAETVTDQEAYEDAFNQYEYAKYKYDKEQQEINVKTSIIQAEDKNLELKLTRLDNERNAVNTEIEAVKKVVDDNIQKSFKTFNG